MKAYWKIRHQVPQRKMLRWTKFLYTGIILTGFVGLTYFYLIDELVSKSGIRKTRSGLIVEKIVSFAEDYLNQLSKYPCPNLTRVAFDGIEIVNDLWQKPVEIELYLFSAHYDQRYQSSSGRRHHFVRIFSSNLGLIDFNVYCQVWYNNRTEPIVVRSEATEIWSNAWDKSSKTFYYRPYLISCPIPIEISEQGIHPFGVSVVLKPCQNSKSFLKLKTPETMVMKNFAVCVKGLDFEEDLSSKITEWIEMQLLLGADPITFYLFNVHPNVLKVLEHYSSKGKAILRNLTLPGKQPNSPTSARSEFLKKNTWQKRRHELIPYNDCLYSHIYSHRFIALLDIDEIIVPTKFRTWEEMYNTLIAEQPGSLEKYASFSVQNLYFFDEFGITKDPDLPNYHYILRHIHRSANFSKPGYAIKSFFLTNITLLAFNHYALTPLYSTVRRNAMLRTDVARLHHYRTGCPAGMKAECENNFMKFTKKDTTIWRWKDELMNRTDKTLKILGLFSS